MYATQNSKDFHKKQGYPMKFQILKHISAIQNTVRFEYSHHPMGEDDFRQNVGFYTRKILPQSPA